MRRSQVPRAAARADAGVGGMKVVVYPHRLEIGGSQLNAIELAGAVRDLGHEVIVFGQPGGARRAHRRAWSSSSWPRRSRAGGRRPRSCGRCDRLVAERGVDVVHGYEWTTALEAYWGPRARDGVPAVATVMSMAVAPFLPLDMPARRGDGADRRPRAAPGARVRGGHRAAGGLVAQRRPRRRHRRRSGASHGLDPDVRHGGMRHAGWRPSSSSRACSPRSTRSEGLGGLRSS